MTEVNPQVGQTLQPIVREARRALIMLFSGYPLKRNIHTDEDFAIERGLPGVIMEGVQTYAFLSQMLVGYFGESWFSTGKLDVAFLKVILPDDVLTTGGEIDGVEQVEGGVAVTIKVWVDSQRGERVAAGTASGTLRVLAAV